MCVGLWLGGGPAGEGSARLSLSLPAWLQLGVPLTPAPHLHVQKSPVLKWRGVSPHRQRVWSAICLSAYESSSSTATVCLSDLICCFHM